MSMAQELSPREERALQRAVAILEGKSFIGRLTELTGEPVSQMLRRLPAPVTRQINRTVRRALLQAQHVALYKLGSAGLPDPPPALFQFASAITGGVSGFFGMATLAVELPVTTAMMLRS